ncbi:hypothetical protein HZY97_03070 [Sphingomonas sp. R-74633]|uniref:DUF7677 family protein n=1 Tax=Sphingomonas sp. R-74633 TaxID=2751188 RepID=UPI0015D0FA84|nr:hypothetical protein [Sphingomonas sp. R-74633]NYT39726.1 hypothetical protein [Sphingomonas sp. R-74633]
MKLSGQFSGALRTFAFWIANRSVGNPVLEGVDYSCIFEEPGALEQAFAIFANVIEIDERGGVLNAKWAEHRAAQYILQYVTGKAPEPPFEIWETELHGPPPRVDPLPWPTSV